MSSQLVGFVDVNGDGRRTAMDYWTSGPTVGEHFSRQRRDDVPEDAEFNLVNETTGRYEHSRGQLELSNNLVCDAAQPN